MNTRFSMFAIALGSALSISPPIDAAPRSKHHLVLPRNPITPGQRVVLEVAPPVSGLPTSAPSNRAPQGSDSTAAPQFRYAWQVVSGPGTISLLGVYSAPYVIARGQESARVELLVKDVEGGLDTLVSEDLRLAPGVFPGADSCLGPGQTFDEFGLDASLDELPEVLRRVPARDPAARARKSEQRLVVRTIVCRSGKVLDAWAVWPGRATPDAALGRAAVDAALQWIFQPGIRSGKPMASFVDIPFAFAPGAEE